MLVTIVLPERGPDLPPSLRFRKETPVAVTIQRDPGDPQGAVAFEVFNISAANGSAAIVGVHALHESGVIQVRGDAQTEPDHSGQLVIRALLDGNVIGSSNAFSVCAHPTCVENGPQHETMTLDHPESDHSSVGLKVWIRLPSDSDVDADLSAVQEKEVVAEAHDFTGALTKGPKSGNSGWQRAPEVQPDRHRFRADVMNVIDQTQLKGNEGGMSNDQLDLFYCERCGMSEDDAVEIPNSGYRVTRVFSTIADGSLRLVLVKHPQACNVKGYQSEAGPSQPLQIEATVPKTEVDTGKPKN